MKGGGQSWSTVSEIDLGAPFTDLASCHGLKVAVTDWGLLYQTGARLALRVRHGGALLALDGAGSVALDEARSVRT